MPDGSRRSPLHSVSCAAAQGADEVDGLPRSARGRRLRPAQRTGDASSDDDDPLSPSVALPRNARKRRTGWEESLRRPNTPARHPSSADATPKEHPPRLRQVRSPCLDISISQVLSPAPTVHLCPGLVAGDGQASSHESSLHEDKLDVDIPFAQKGRRCAFC